MSLVELIREYNPKRIIIEPTGVGKLSDIISVINMTKKSENIELNAVMTIVDTVEFEDFIVAFGDFFTDQIQHANIIALSKSQLVDESVVNKVIDSIRKINHNANIIATPWDDLKAKDILDVAESNNGHKEIDELHNDNNCEHHHDHEHEHHHEHHHVHDAAEQSFEFLSFETMKKYSKEKLESILSSLNDTAYGKVLRAKGSLLRSDRNWVDFDFTPNGFNITEGKVKLIGQTAVIGIELNKDDIRNLFD